MDLSLKLPMAHLKETLLIDLASNTQPTNIAGSKKPVMDLHDMIRVSTATVALDTRSQIRYVGIAEASLSGLHITGA